MYRSTTPFLGALPCSHSSRLGVLSLDVTLVLSLCLSLADRSTPFRNNGLSYRSCVRTPAHSDLVPDSGCSGYLSNPSAYTDLCTHWVPYKISVWREPLWLTVSSTHSDAQILAVDNWMLSCSLLWRTLSLQRVATELRAPLG